MLSSVWAVVTSYRPENLERVLSPLLTQAAGVIVVDDGSGPDAAGELGRARALGADVREMSSNGGIAVALNTGMTAAFDNGADAVVTFDQDSHVPADFIARLVAQHDELEEAGLPSCPIVPQFFADVSQARGADADGRLVAENSIQSGMLISRRLVEQVGLLREDFFIDLVDTEFELRCVAAGRAVRAVPGLRLPHRLGARYRRRGTLVPVLPLVTLSSPFRYFYRMRNRILLEHGYRRRFPLRLLRDGVTDRVHFLIALALARPRRAMWAVLRAGTRAGHRRQGGRAPAEIMQLAAGIRWAADRLED